MQQDSVASKVKKARAAADGAVARCDAARDAAEREAASVVTAGDDVARRGAAALAAQEAAVRCAAASLKAREVAARCEAVAEEVPANHRGDATFAAQQARAAAARCDADGGAIAACRAADAFADSCVAACGDAAAPTVAARQAAKRYVLARDDVSTAFLVAEQTATWRDLLTPLRNRARESAAGHKEARKDAITAALAARKAALRCAAESRRAVSAASVARDAASRCEAAGADGAAARESADRCVAARAGADVAASEAREAAASCDAALVGPDEKFVDKMRGWLMTVATLFVGIAFQAAIQPPAWMFSLQPTPSDWEAASGTPSPARAPSPAAIKRQPEDTFVELPRYIYITLNTFTMAGALTMLVMLLTMKKSMSRFTLFYIKVMLATLTISVAGSFIAATWESRYNLLSGLFFSVVLTIIVSVYPVCTFVLGRMENW